MFQSAVRIAVSLKRRVHRRRHRCVNVSIRRADRCLAEGRQRRITAAGRPVSIRRADRCLAEVQEVDKDSGVIVLFQSAVRIAVSLKVNAYAGSTGAEKFQSAVRIAVSLKPAPWQNGVGHAPRFNPPCGSLSR